MKTRDVGLNTAPPRVAHIDLNSCFAIIEQQANRLLRGKPVGVAAYDTPRGFVLAASYQAKALGIKLGVNVAEARQLCPGIIIMTPDPTKYREAHRRFKELLLEYSSDVTPKSIDEFVVNLSATPAIRQGLSMEAIGADIKQKVAERLGEAVTVNVGIGTNRFLAKLAAGLNKPDGLDTITAANVRSIYGQLGLRDLPGINYRYEARLNAAGIYTPLDFLAADQAFLRRRVFKSIVGFYWYLRLRGWETDDAPLQRRSIGHQYALPKKTTDKQELSRLLMKLCEKVGRRLRGSGSYAGGIHLYLSFASPPGMRDNGFIGGQPRGPQAWHRGQKVSYPLYSTQDIFTAAQALLAVAELYGPVRGMAITVFRLVPAEPEQLALFSDDRAMAGNRRISRALDHVNDRYGEFVVTPARMMDMRGAILDRIAFGSVRDLHGL